MHVYVVCRVFSWVYSLCCGASIIQRLRKSEEELTTTHCIHPMLHNYLSLSPENTLKTMTWEKLEQCLFKVGTGFRWWTMHTISLFVRLQRKLEVILYARMYDGKTYIFTYYMATSSQSRFSHFIFINGKLHFVFILLNDDFIRRSRMSSSSLSFCKYKNRPIFVCLLGCFTNHPHLVLP